MTAAVTALAPPTADQTLLILTLGGSGHRPRPRRLAVRRSRHTPCEFALAATIARDLRLSRETAHEALCDQLSQEGAVT